MITNNEVNMQLYGPNMINHCTPTFDCIQKAKSFITNIFIETIETLINTGKYTRIAIGLGTVGYVWSVIDFILYSKMSGSILFLISTALYITAYAINKFKGDNRLEENIQLITKQTEECYQNQIEFIEMLDFESSELTTWGKEARDKVNRISEVATSISTNNQEFVLQAKKFNEELNNDMKPLLQKFQLAMKKFEEKEMSLNDQVFESNRSAIESIISLKEVIIKLSKEAEEKIREKKESPDLRPLVKEITELTKEDSSLSVMTEKVDRCSNMVDQLIERAKKKKKQKEFDIQWQKNIAIISQQLKTKDLKRLKLKILGSKTKMKKTKSIRKST